LAVSRNGVLWRDGCVQEWLYGETAVSRNGSMEERLYPGMILWRNGCIQKGEGKHASSDTGKGE
jgi:hypothetical protein